MRHIRVGGMALSPPGKSCKLCPLLHYCDKLLKLIVRTPDQACFFMLCKRERETCYQPAHAPYSFIIV